MNLLRTNRSLLRVAFTIFAFTVASFAQGQDSPIRIIDKPKPELPEDYGTLDAQGIVRLNVEFLADGSIGTVIPVAKLTENLTRLAITAAKKIKFEPSKKAGIEVTSWSTVDYPYSWYGFWRPRSYSVDPPTTQPDAKAQSVIQKAIQNLGGDKYLGVKSQIGRGRFSIFKDNVLVSFQTFTDIIVFPEKERTEFKGGSGRSVQVNNGDTGWVYDGATEKLRDQDEGQVKSFKQGMRTSLDNLLRGYWHGNAEVTYVGKRAATLGKRNDVIKLTYKDGFAVEFEFAADDGLPAKAIYKRTNADNEEVKEEDRYAQFVEIAGVRTPFIIDRFTGGVPSSRINYESVEFNKSVPDSVFAKPGSAKEAKRDVKF